MMIPKAVVFDLGKVLIDFDYNIGLRWLLPRINLSAEELRQLVPQSAVFHQYELGTLTSSEFLHEVKKATGFRGDLNDFAQFFDGMFTAIPRMVELHGDLCRRGIPTYVFSNTNELAVRQIEKQFPFFAEFTGRVLSYRHRCMKPDAGLYEALEQLAGLRGAELFYLDDVLENVEAARRRGWQAVVHMSSEASRAAIQRAGLL